MARTTRDPFEVKLSPEKADDLVKFLVREIQYAQDARATIVGTSAGDGNDLDRWHTMYEQGNVLRTSGAPWPNAADLGSYLVTESVDAMRARMVATVFTDPIWIVEGWGAAAERAPLVEAFHQWKAESEKLQTFLARAIHNSLIEGTGILEVSDRVVLRHATRRINALVQMDSATGRPALGPDGQPVPARDIQGRFIDAGPDEPALELFSRDVVRSTAGPAYRVLSLRDFWILPGHAAETEDIWAYAKRVYRRLPELKQREKDGYYKNIDQLGDSGEREQTSAEARQGQQIPAQFDETAEKEIYEVTYLGDLEGNGYEEWYIITLSVLHRTLLRIQRQDYGTPHYIRFTPFPRPTSVWGYSYAGDKLGSLYDEHAALRNLFADRSVLAACAPMLQLEGSPWDPGKQPIGPFTVLPVRDTNEIKQLQINDVPNSIMEAIRFCLAARERLSGMNDTTTGQLAQADRTLGEVRLVTQQSWIRIDEAVKHFQEGMEDLFQLRHIIWQNKLREAPEPMPGDLLLSMQQRGLSIEATHLTADLLAGTFRGKPHGSVEGSDLSQIRADFTQMMTALVQLAQAVPSVRDHLNQPNVIRSFMGQIARIYRWPDRANLVEAFSGAPPPPAVPPGGPQAPGLAPNATQGQLPNVPGIPTGV